MEQQMLVFLCMVAGVFSLVSVVACLAISKESRSTLGTVLGYMTTCNKRVRQEQVRRQALEDRVKILQLRVDVNDSICKARTTSAMRYTDELAENEGGGLADGDAVDERQLPLL